MYSIHAFKMLSSLVLHPYTIPPWYRDDPSTFHAHPTSHACGHLAASPCTVAKVLQDARCIHTKLLGLINQSDIGPTQPKLPHSSRQYSRNKIQDPQAPPETCSRKHLIMKHQPLSPLVLKCSRLRASLAPPPGLLALQIFLPAWAGCCLGLPVP